MSIILRQKNDSENMNCKKITCMRNDFVNARFHGQYGCRHSQRKSL